MCCTEAEKANQLRMEDLSIQVKESTSTVNQLSGSNSGTTTFVFEDLDDASEPPAAFFGNLRSMASAPCEPTSLVQGDLQNEQMNGRDTLRILQF